jgi:hypothetical protein
MAKSRIHPEILNKIKTISGKRSLVVVNHVIKHGHITTEDLKGYGYEHPPRAVRDVREQGLPLKRFWTKNSQGQRIAGYCFGNPDDIKNDRIGGRKIFSKEFIQNVIHEHDNKCAICQGRFETRYLQIDHKIPYEVGSDDSAKRNLAGYMPLCATCNRAKSWSCEHCENWLIAKNKKKCQSCYWGNPEKYSHVALNEIRKLEITWQGEETGDYEVLRRQAHKNNQPMPEFVKAIIKKVLSR